MLSFVMCKQHEFSTRKEIASSKKCDMIAYTMVSNLIDCRNHFSLSIILFVNNNIIIENKGYCDGWYGSVYAELSSEGRRYSKNIDAF